MNIDTGINKEDRKSIANGLSRVLADTYSLYLMTHNFHWNVTGPMFQTLHLMFEQQYNELWLATDLIAERIRSLGEFAPASHSKFAELSSIKIPNDVPKAEEMIKQACQGHEAVVKTARTLFAAAEKVHDEVTCDLLTQRLQIHEKTAWMLRSMLD